MVMVFVLIWVKTKKCSKRRSLSNLTLRFFPVFSDIKETFVNHFRMSIDTAAGENL